jgi:hypothetical protein
MWWPPYRDSAAASPAGRRRTATPSAVVRDCLNRHQPPRTAFSKVRHLDRYPRSRVRVPSLQSRHLQIWIVRCRSRRLIGLDHANSSQCGIHDPVRTDRRLAKPVRPCVYHAGSLVGLTCRPNVVGSTSDSATPTVLLVARARIPRRLRDLGGHTQSTAPGPGQVGGRKDARKFRELLGRSHRSFRLCWFGPGLIPEHRSEST